MHDIVHNMPTIAYMLGHTIMACVDGGPYDELGI